MHVRVTCESSIEFLVVVFRVSLTDKTLDTRERNQTYRWKYQAWTSRLSSVYHLTDIIETRDEYKM